MHNTISDKTKRRIVLILDLLSICISFSIAAKIRFPRNITPWQSQLYRTIFGFLLLMWLLIYTFRHVRGRFFDIDRNDSFSNLVRVVRDRFILYVILMIFLFGTKAGAQVSRRFLLYLVLLDVGIDFALRMLFRHIIIKMVRSAAPEKSHILLITEKSRISVALALLQNGLLLQQGECPADGIALEERVPDDSEPVELIRYDRTGENIPVLGQVSDVFKPERWTASGDCRDFRKVYIYLPGTAPDEISRILNLCAQVGVAAEVCLTMNGNALPARMIHRGAGHGTTGRSSDHSSYAAAEFTNMQSRCNVLGVHFAVTNVDAAVAFILGRLDGLKGQYVCFSNVHTTVMAREKNGYRKIQNRAVYTFADGAPIASAEHRRGFTEAERCAGPDFMDAVFRATLDGRIGHYFYGSTPETVNLLEKRLKKLYPGIRICGVYSPPFRKLDEIPAEEDEEDIRRINESGAQIIWIGLGAPKQEEWMALHQGRVNGTMFGVGAGFNFYAGNVKRAPQWMQSAGLEWFYRLCQDPKRLFNRYFVTNIKFFWYLFLDSLKKDSRNPET